MEEAQDQRNQRRLTQNEDGSFEFIWEADNDVLEAAEQAVLDAERELEAFRQQAEVDFATELKDLIDRASQGDPDLADDEALRAAIDDLRAQFDGILDEDFMNIDEIDDLLYEMEKFFENRDAILDEIARQELTPQNIGYEVGKAYKDSAQDVGKIIANEMVDALESLIDTMTTPTYDANAISRQVTPTPVSNNNTYEINIEAQFPAVNDALSIKNSFNQLEFEAIQRAGQYNASRPY